MSLFGLLNGQDPPSAKKFEENKKVDFHVHQMLNNFRTDSIPFCKSPSDDLTHFL